MTTRSTALTQIDGLDLKYFVVHAALLLLIDPVRDAPTRTPLDEDPDGDISGGQQLKQRFLDSFALICSTSSKGAETASAVCLEQNVPAEAVLRVARNHGITRGDLNGLEQVLQILRSVAGKQKSPKQAEPDILRILAELDRGRVLSMAETAEKRGIKRSIREAHSKLLSGLATPEISAKQGLKPWLESCPFTSATAAPQTWSPSIVASLITWASEARWSYSKQLQSLIGPDDMQKSPWMDSLYKIARYRFAIRSMVNLAAKQPEVFANIRIEAIDAPKQRPFSVFKERGLLFREVKHLVGDDAERTMDLLKRHLEADNIEEKLHKACAVNLTLHAEMQLVVFYEGNPDLAPRMPFVGTSKKACFLCHEYLLVHQLRLQVSACHQKIYPSWMPPPYYPTGMPRRPKSPSFTKLSDRVKTLTKRELRTALTAPRRPKSYDSTAGPSLTITGSVSTGVGSRGQAILRLPLRDSGVSESWEGDEKTDL